MSNIDPTKPISGTPTTQSVRDNFSTIKTELEAFQLSSGASLVGISRVWNSIVSFVTLTLHQWINGRAASLFEFIPTSQHAYILSDDTASQNAALVSAGIAAAMSSGIDFFAPSGKYNLGANTVAVSVATSSDIRKLFWDLRGASFYYSGTSDAFQITDNGEPSRSAPTIFGGKLFTTGDATSGFRLTDIGSTTWNGTSITASGTGTIGWYIKNDSGWSEVNRFVFTGASGCDYDFQFDGATQTGGSGTDSFARTYIYHNSGAKKASVRVRGAVYGSDITIRGNLGTACEAAVLIDTNGGMSRSVVSAFVEFGASAAPYTYLIKHRSGLSSTLIPRLRNYDQTASDIRLMGQQEQAVTLTASGTTATATRTAHGVSPNDLVTIYGANESDYNVTGARVFNVTANTYDYTMGGSPASPATGTIYEILETKDFEVDYFSRENSGSKSWGGVSGHRSIGFGTTSPDWDAGEEYTSRRARVLSLYAGPTLGSKPNIVGINTGSARTSAGTLGFWDAWYRDTGVSPSLLYKVASIRYTRGSAADESGWEFWTRSTGAAIRKAAEITSGGVLNILQGTSTTLLPVTSKGFINTTQVGNVGGGTDTLQTNTLPANALSAAGKGLRITQAGSTANNANGKTLTSQFGGQTLVSQALTANLAGKWRVDYTVWSTGSSAQYYEGSLTYDTATVPTVVLFSGTLSVTDSGTIAVRCQGAATSDNDIVQNLNLGHMFN